MPQTKTKLTDDEKERWLSFCNSENMTESDMLRRLIEQALSDGKKIETPNQRPVRNGQISIRMTEKELTEIDEFVIKEGFSSRSHFMRAMLKGQSKREIIFTDSEIFALGEAGRELSAIGRNLNQIARTLNIDANAHVSPDELKTLLESAISITEKERKIISTLRKKSLSKWR